MKLILASFGSYGDIHPFIWLGRELKKTGHDVLFIANPFFSDLICKEGFEFHPAGTVQEYQSAATPAVATGNRFRDQGERIAASRRLFNSMFLKPATETYNCITANRTVDTVIIGHFYAYGAKLAAEKHNIPYINVCLSPYWLKGFAKPAGLASMLRKAAANASTGFIDGQLFTKPFNALRGEIGLGPMQKSSNRWMFEGNNLCLFPAFMLDFKLEGDIKASYAGFPLQADSGGNLPAYVENFLHSHENPIVFTPGSAVTDSAKFFQEALTVLEKLGRPGILLSRSKNGLPEKLPEDVLYSDFIPLELLLGRCSAIVHHGGIGTAAQALACGVPQLLCPRMDEQRENARALKRLGVSESLPYDSLDGSSMAVLLSKLTCDSSIQANCREIQGMQLTPQEGFLDAFLCR